MPLHFQEVILDSLYSTKKKAFEETKRHNAEMEELQRARDRWNQKRIEVVDYINETCCFYIQRR